MKVRRTLMALVAVATAAAGAFAVVGPAQATEVTTIELPGRKDVSLGEVRELVTSGKHRSEGPDVVAVASDTGKVPTTAQVGALLSGKSVDGFVLYRTVAAPSADTTVGGLVEGTPLPAVVAYRASWGGRRTEVSIICSDFCRIYVRILPIS